MSNIIKTVAAKRQSVKPFIMEHIQDSSAADRHIGLSEEKLEGYEQDSAFQNRLKREFVIDLEGQIKTDEQRLQELKKKYYADLAKRAKKIEANAIEDGIKKGMVMLAPAIDAFKNAVTELSKLRNNFYNKAEKELLELVLAVSRAAVNHELTINKDVVVNTIKHAVNNIIDQEYIIINVNPADLEYAVSCKPDIQAFAAGTKNLEFKANVSVSRGGCRIETNFGDIDSRIDVNLAKIEKELRRAG